jgi:uncharacterized membrane protein
MTPVPALAALGSPTYQLVLVLHLLAVIVAFAPVAAHPVRTVRARRRGPDAVATAAADAAFAGRAIHLPALVLAGGLGLVLVLLSDGVWDLAELWLSLAFLVWFGLLGVIAGLILPAERRVAGGDPGAQRRADLGGAISTVLLIGMLYLMVAKPTI